MKSRDRYLSMGFSDYLCASVLFLFWILILDWRTDVLDGVTLAKRLMRDMRLTRK